MANPIDDLCYQLALANRIVAHEGVLDGFGHISVRHPTRSGHYLLSRSRSPELVEPTDILELDVDSKVVTPGNILPYGECVIHGEIFRARPDVMAICHHHSPAILPFCLTDLKLVPINGLGATMGEVVPSWDSQDEFGDTPMVLTSIPEGASLARALGPHAMVLMRRHGATVVGASIKEMVFRSIMTHRNAELLLRAHAVGKVTPLSPGEAKRAHDYSLQERPLGRAWEYWVTRLTKAGELPPRTRTRLGSGAAARPKAGRARAARR
ncbi:MAG: class II aldolase/adducin family protein [Hyphomicrobiales bacterium]|nr:class II aldolase/adducin family protein [Hyphomicrobiales bacterium]